MLISCQAFRKHVVEAMLRCFWFLESPTLKQAGAIPVTAQSQCHAMQQEVIYPRNARLSPFPSAESVCFLHTSSWTPSYKGQNYREASVRDNQLAQLCRASFLHEKILFNRPTICSRLFSAFGRHLWVCPGLLTGHPLSNIIWL